MSRVWLLLLAITLQCTGSAQAAGNLSPCKLPGVPRAAKCGVVEVPENWDKPTGRKLSLAVAVIPAEVPGAHNDPIVPLMGGPGEDAISSAEYFIGQWGPLLRDRDLLLIDQRGTGKSGALRCPLFDPKNPAASLRELYPVARVERCAKELSSRTDLTQYTYTNFARDLEHVRRTLGYGQLNLQSGSYGTRAAQFYLRVYPQSVRTIYFGSVVPLDVITSLTMAKSAEGARNQCSTHAQPTLRVMRRFLTCARSSARSCSSWRQARRRSLAVARPSGSGRRPIVRTAPRICRGSFIARTQATGARSRKPFSRVSQGVDEEASFGLFFAITCNDDVAFIREEDIERETRGTFLGDYRVRQQQAACRYWPKVSPPTDRTPPKSAVPALFVSGANDAASPLWFTQRVAPNFSERAEVVVVGHGHTEWNDCIARIWDQFVRDGSVRNVRGKTCDAVPRPPFKTL